MFDTRNRNAIYSKNAPECDEALVSSFVDIDVLSGTTVPSSDAPLFTLLEPVPVEAIMM